MQARREGRDNASVTSTFITHLHLLSTLSTVLSLGPFDGVDVLTTRLDSQEREREGQRERERERERARRRRMAARYVEGGGQNIDVHVSDEHAHKLCWG
jgi:hypothetical protein